MHEKSIPSSAQRERVATVLPWWPCCGVNSSTYRLCHCESYRYQHIRSNSVGSVFGSVDNLDTTSWTFMNSRAALKIPVKVMFRIDWTDWPRRCRGSWSSSKGILLGRLPEWTIILMLLALNSVDCWPLPLISPTSTGTSRRNIGSGSNVRQYLSSDLPVQMSTWCYNLRLTLLFGASRRRLTTIEGWMIFNLTYSDTWSHAPWFFRCLYSLAGCDCWRLVYSKHRWWGTDGADGARKYI